MCVRVLSDVVSNVETCRRWSAERACRIIAATVTGRAASVRVPSAGKQRKSMCVNVCVQLLVPALPSFPPISISLVGALQTVADFQMFSSCVTQTSRKRHEASFNRLGINLTQEKNSQ